MFARHFSLARPLDVDMFEQTVSLFLLPKGEEEEEEDLFENPLLLLDGLSAHFPLTYLLPA